MAETIYDDLNLKQNEAKEFVHEQVTSFPADSRKGRIVDHTGLGGLYRCTDGTGDTTQVEKWEKIGTGAGGTGPSTQKKVKRFNMTAGQLTYVLSELTSDDDEIQCFVNGIEVTFTRSGVNITITTYTAGTIENGWELSVYYFIIL